MNALRHVARCHIDVTFIPKTRAAHVCADNEASSTHSESSFEVIQLGGEKLGICIRLTLGTDIFGTLGI